MCDVTSDNFDELLPAITDCISRCEFVSFDTEFTALRLGEDTKSSLFDSVENRYQKLRSIATESTVCQVGLCFFCVDSTNTYIAHPFNFFVCPRSFGPVDVTFACQASSLEFLRSHNFDFNKFLSKGIGYVNAEQEKLLLSSLHGDFFLGATERNLPWAHEDRLKEMCSDVSKWLRSPTGDARKVGEEKVLACGPLEVFVVHQEMRNKFPTLWTFPAEEKRAVLLRVVSNEERKHLSEEDLIWDLVDHLRGFSKVIRLISECGKPMVGHNCLQDLLRLQHQFISSLPPAYHTLKKGLHETFPLLFDTKLIAYKIRSHLEEGQSKMANFFVSGNLEDLYLAMSSDQPGVNSSFSPKIHQSEDKHFIKSYQGNTQLSHEAGFDAYVTGFCFLKIAHLATSVDEMSIVSLRVLNFKELLMGVSLYKNQVNLSRGIIPFVNFSGADPPSFRPQWLLAKPKRKNCPLNHISVAGRLSCYGVVDVRKHYQGRVLIAVGNRRRAEDILRAFCLGNDKEMTVVRYRPIKHGWLLGSSSGLLLVSSCLMAGTSAAAAALTLFLWTRKAT